MISIVENIQCRRSAGPGVPYRVDLDQNAGNGRIPNRAISCLTTNWLTSEFHTDRRARLKAGRINQHSPRDDANVIDMMFPVADMHSKIPAAVLVLDE
jgi:hypothetical protein